jgi:hypothetical protein
MNEHYAKCTACMRTHDFRAHARAYARERGVGGEVIAVITSPPR